MKKYRYILFCLALLTAFCLLSCANAEPINACLTGKQFGFFFGLLHGFITPISFVGSLLSDDIAIYAVNNTGGWYDLGFLLGSSGWGFMAGSRSKKD